MISNFYSKYRSFFSSSLIFIACLSFLILMVYNRQKVPVSGDVGAFMLAGEELKGNPFTFGLQGHTNILLWYYRLFGNNQLTAASASSLWGIIFLFCFYRFLHIRYSSTASLITIIMLGSLPYFLVISASGLELSMALSLMMNGIFLAAAKTTKRLEIWTKILGGISLGFSLYIYPGSWLGIILIFAYSVIFFWPATRKLTNFLSVLTGTIIIYFPQIIFNIRQPKIVFERMDAVSYFRSAAWINQNTDQVILHLVEIFKPYFFPINQYVIFFNHTPFLPTPLSLLSIVGFIMLFIKSRKWGIFASCWFIVGSSLAGFATNEVAGSRYLFILPSLFIPIAALFESKIKHWSKFIPIVIALIIVIINVKFYWQYHFKDLETIAGDDEFLWRAESIFKEPLKNVPRIYFLTTGLKYPNSNPNFYLTVKEKDIYGIPSTDQLKELTGNYSIVITGEKLDETSKIISICNENKIRDYNVYSSRSPILIGRIIHCSNSS